MVKITEISQANAAFAKQGREGLVFVFAGATSGIGAATLEKLASMVRSATFHVAGRSASRFASQRARVEAVNPKLSIKFFECDVSLLAGVDAFARSVVAAESKVDYLFMSQGKLPLAGAHYTSEALEAAFALSYYSRMRLTSALLPLLQRAPQPRVLCVLNGGHEGALAEDDLALAKPGAWSAGASMAHTTTLSTLALDLLSAKHTNITFLHAYPGLVRTGIAAAMAAPESAGWLGRTWVAVLRGLIGSFLWLVGTTAETAGERQAYHLTGLPVDGGERQPGRAVLVDDKSEIVRGTPVLARYRAEGWPERVWEFTVGVFESVVASASPSAPLYAAASTPATAPASIRAG
ncbi:hypothetical protein B0T24DRAFT_677819 [Lasiosphaeria ovina]|uniref:Uncharacterized protein n=1 Tax=Lasiosphaeria ovina TaxID=92902 RepID=A0AAE0KJ72_9PEZI|nr:hypothetical protein B0T24DRAFT_677819 [Lasiosphaeria ovina]